MSKVTSLFKDTDPKVRALYDALLDVLDESRFHEMSFASIVGTLETIKFNIMREMV